MTTPVLAVVSLPVTSHNPLDDSSNSFAFNLADVAPATLDTVAASLNTFYNTATGPHAISYYLSAVLSRGAQAVTIKFYNLTGHLNGSAHGSPIAIRQMTLGASIASGLEMPEGVCIASSFHSAYGTDVEFGAGTRPRARDRGRVFLGGLMDAAIQTEALGRPFVSADCRSSISLATKALADELAGAWCVWSRKKAALAPVVGGWVDDRFDYQRRREDQGLIRTNWAAA